MLRRLVVALLVLAGAVGALFLFRGAIARQVVPRVVARTLASNPVANLDDGLHVFLCGAGSPLPSPQRSGPCTAIIAGEAIFVFDVGAGSPRNFSRTRVPIGGVDAVFLTHFHSDHIDGLGELATLRWVNGGHGEALPVFGPPGVERVVDGFNAAYALDAGYRVAHHGASVVPPRGRGMRARPFEKPEPGVLLPVLERNDVTISAFAVDHEPIEPAVGYKITYGNRSVVISGDTKPSESVRKMAEGADVLIHEALSEELVWMLHEAAEMTSARTSQRSPPTSSTTTRRRSRPPRSRRPRACTISSSTTSSRR